MNHYTLHVPVDGKDNVKRYPRVGVMFENTNRETGEVYFNIRLDFPVGATELLAFPPKDEQPYLDPDLTLARLARRLHVPIKQLSLAINMVKGENVSRYVNGFRIRSACARFKARGYRD